MDFTPLGIIRKVKSWYIHIKIINFILNPIDIKCETNYLTHHIFYPLNSISNFVLVISSLWLCNSFFIAKT